MGPKLYTYAYYVSLRLDMPWSAPVLYGKLPNRPENVAADEFYEYAKVITTLLRPFRDVSDIATRHGGAVPWRHGPVEFRKAFVAEFIDWEKSVLAAAARFNGNCEPLGEVWWAERIRQTIRDYDFAADKHGASADAAPDASALAGLPPWQAVADGDSGDVPPRDDVLMESDSDDCLAPVEYEECEDAPAGDSKRNVGRSEDPRSLRCGALPDGVDLRDHLRDLVMPAEVRSSRSAENMYVKDF